MSEPRRFRRACSAYRNARLSDHYLKIQDNGNPCQLILRQLIKNAGDAASEAVVSVRRIFLRHVPHYRRALSQPSAVLATPVDNQGYRVVISPRGKCVERGNDDVGNAATR